MKKYLPLVLLPMLMLVLRASPATAQSFLYELKGEPLFLITYPLGWSVFAESDEQLATKRPEGQARMPILVSAEPPEGPLWFGTWVVDKIDTFEEAEDYLGSLTEHIFDDVEISTFKTGTHHGMNFRYYDGTATKLTREPKEVRREKVDFFAAFFIPGEGMVGISLYVGLPAATDKYQDALERSLQSIRPFASAAARGEE